MAADEYWTLVVGNLLKAMKMWAWIMRILGRKVNNPRVLGIFFKGGTGGSFIMVRDVRAELLHGIGPGKFPA